jgi:hypothetical protein
MPEKAECPIKEGSNFWPKTRTGAARISLLKDLHVAIKKDHPS